MFAIKSGLFLLGLAAFAVDAAAQQPCTSRADLLKVLAEKYKEGPVSLGTTSGTAIIEIYASEQGTFTIIASQPSGVSCIVAAGKNWEQVGPPPKSLTSL